MKKTKKVIEAERLKMIEIGKVPSLIKRGNMQNTSLKRENMQNILYNISIK